MRRSATGLIAIVLLALAAAPASAAPADQTAIASLQLQAAFDCTQVSEIPQAECQALVALYNSTNGPGWTNNTGWLATSTPCSWYGVTCGTGQVSLLALSTNRLSGSIPPQLGNLTNLTTLDLRSNQLSGGIPPQLGSLANLNYLYLTNNQLTGNIPPELGNLTKLSWLFLDVNGLSGSIPPQVGNLANLTYLRLNDNQLSGSIPLELGNLTYLNSLYLDHNLLTGSIPHELGKLLYLSYLSLSYNQLTGSIPPELSNSPYLYWLLLNFNQLSGSIPPELGNATSLLNLQLAGNQLSGSIPPQLGNLTNLTFLYLDANQLSGSIPPELGNITGLGYLTMSGNQLSGTIPAELGNLTNLTWLMLTGNQLVGPMPQTLTKLHPQIFDFDIWVCFPANAGFPAWLATIPSTNQGVPCGSVPSATALVSSANPALYGDTLTFTASVTAPWVTTPGVITPAGTVTITVDNLPPVTRTLAGGQASYTLATDLNVGTHQVAAQYGGDATLGPSTASVLAQQISPSPTGAIDPATGGELVCPTNAAILTRIQAPAGAVAQTTTLVCSPPGTLQPAPAGFAFTAEAFDLAAYQGGQLLSGFQFTAPVMVTIVYNDADVQGLTEGGLVLRYWNGTAGVWQDAACGPYARYPAQNMLVVPICHLSQFALLGPKGSLAYLPLLRRSK